MYKYVEMRFYNILRLWRGKMPWSLKFLGIWGMHLARRRMIGIYIDPVLGCNLRCRMCYFSDPEKRKEMHGVMAESQLSLARKALFHRALKLQIGCGAEPTLYPRLESIVRAGHEARIPYISLTTNGQLIASGKISLENLVGAGLNEITLSMHGTSATVYEELMPGAKYDCLIRLLGIIADVRKRYPDFVVRVNFTVNSLNKEDLKGDRFFSVWPEGCLPDIVQLRPVQNLGESDWKDFDPDPLISDYDATIGNVVRLCRGKGITCIAPTLADLGEVATPQGGYEALLESVSYCYISPPMCYKSDFDPAGDTYESYHRRHGTARSLFAAIFRRPGSRTRNVSKKLNYKIR